MFDQFARMFRRSGLDDITDLYDQPEQPEQGFTYKRGPAAQSYMDLIGREPDIQGPSTMQRIGAVLAGIGSGDASVTQRMVQQPYLMNRRLHEDRVARAKSAADFEEKESDNQRQAANYASLEARRRDRSKNELREGVRRTNQATAAGARADKIFDWRVSEKDQDQKALEERSRLAREGTESRFRRGQAATESRFKRTQDRLNDPSISPSSQAALEKLANDKVFEEFQDKFDVITDKKTGKKTRQLKADIDDETAEVIEKRHAQIKAEIAKRKRSDYNIDPEDPAELDMEEEVTDPEEEAEDVEGVSTGDEEIDKKLEWINFLMSLGKRFSG